MIKNKAIFKTTKVKSNIQMTVCVNCHTSSEIEIEWNFNFLKDYFWNLMFLNTLLALQLRPTVIWLKYGFIVLSLYCFTITSVCATLAHHMDIYLQDWFLTMKGQEPFQRWRWRRERWQRWVVTCWDPSWGPFRTGSSATARSSGRCCSGPCYNPDCRKSEMCLSTFWRVWWVLVAKRS